VTHDPTYTLTFPRISGTSSTNYTAGVTRHACRQPGSVVKTTDV